MLRVAIPSSNLDFDFQEARPMPFLSAPSTPKGFGDFSLSAPSSPSRLAEFYRSFDDFDEDGTSHFNGGVAFTWEERPGTPLSPKSVASSSPKADDFAFDFRSDLEENSLFAEELFDGGKIKPLKPPPRLQYEDRSPLLSPSRSPRSPIAEGKKMIKNVFSPKKKKDYADPFAVAAENTRNERGRERVSAAGATRNSSRRTARSLSPFRVSEYPWEEDELKFQENVKNQSENVLNLKPTSSSSPVTTTKSSSRKWRLKDLLLFRSASEGRASDKHYKYPSFFRKPEDVKNSSFRSNDINGGQSGTRKKGQVSAHELHYKTNKAASQDMKKKTYLPYKQGILGRFAFSPAPSFGSMAR